MKKKFRIAAAIIMTVLLVTGIYYGAAWWLRTGETWYRYTFHKNHEPFTLRKSTNTDSIYSDRYFKNALKQYSFFDDKDLDQIVKDSYVIPGLRSTRTLNNQSLEEEICTSMVPQGVSLNDSYVFISAYCCTKQHNSVIYMIDRTTHEFIKEIVLPDTAHVGSITYEAGQDNLWLCSHDDSSSLAFVRTIPLQDLESYDTELNEPISYAQNYPIITQIRASFMNIHDNAVYVGYFHSNFSSETSVQRFNLNEEGGLTMVANPMMENFDDPEEILLPNSLAVINGGAQGYTQNDEKAYVLTSAGSINDSLLYTFENVHGEDGNLDARNDQAISCDHLPPMAEEIYLENQKMYVCFESGAYAYRARKCVHMDRIVVFAIDAD